jgi:hypothetical protein
MVQENTIRQILVFLISLFVVVSDEKQVQTLVTN